ncbi:PepSY-associated TM helix domain-containing protein [Gluconobacter wancherniae]|uniref:PepSY-associated TM helix domain-containing protein n=1 Tax=Gluconobacter wancherniae TaxID=1307955 RepID=UPI0030B6D740
MDISLRQRMGWLHEWGGLLFGWLLFPVFVTGTLAMFDTEITRWMQPEVHLVRGVAPTDESLNRVAERLRAAAARGESGSFILLPQPRDPSLRVLKYNGRAFMGDLVDPRDGRVLSVRQTIGGQFFFGFHFTLWLGPFWGAELVCYAALGMCITLISGIMLHLRQILPDFFTFRPAATATRWWLDMHVLMGIAVLPFHIMIACTGLTVAANAFPVRDLVDFVSAKPPPAPVASSAPISEQSWAPTAPLGPLIRQAEALSGSSVRYVLFAPGMATAYMENTGHLSLSDAWVTFDAHDGHLVSKSPPDGWVAKTNKLLNGLHLATNVTLGLRWLYFFGGICSTLMMGSGLVFYTAKRRAKLERGKSGPSAFLSIVEAINVGVVGGVPLACGAYLWANRLLPVALEHRSRDEVAAFFLVWGISFALGVLMVRSQPRHLVWICVLSLWAFLGLGLPFLDAATASVLRVGGIDRVLYASVDLTAFAFGCCALMGALRLGRRAA